MDVNLSIVIGSAVVGLLVGLTGAGGGALMTPMLILLFRVATAAATSSALAAELKGLSSSTGTFLTAPQHLSGGHEVLTTEVSDKLWTAINHDSLAAFARQYPSAVTPATAP